MNGSDERDRSIERLLRQSFRARQHGVTESCLDAETVAAWIDGGLSGPALEIARSHVADCARCQTLVGAMARIPTGVQAGERAPRRWLAWLVPLTAAAAAAALWVAVPENPRPPETMTTDSRTTAVDAKPQEPALVDKQPRSAATKDEQPTEEKRDLSDRDQAQGFERRREDTSRREADRLEPQAEAIGRVAPSASPDQAASAPAPTPPAAAGSVEVQERSANTLAATMRAGGVVIVSPDPSVRWRLLGSTVELSTNGGVSWDPVSTGITTQLTAGVAPSTSVCWVIGRGGVVALSTDGRSFSRVTFPEMTDLSSIQAIDARTASVTTMDGRTFGTTDGGLTWVRRQ